MNPSLRRGAPCALAALLALGACSTPDTLDGARAARYRDKTLAVASTAEVVSFRSATTDKTRLGAVGEQLQRTEGDSLVQSAGIGDPAEVVGAELSTRLHQALATRPAPEVAPIRAERLDATELAAQARPADLVLALRTTDWRAQPLVAAPTLYQARVEVEAQLIDTETATVVARSRCAQAAPGGPEQAPTWDDLVAHSARRLKQALQAAETACAQELGQGLLGR